MALDLNDLFPTFARMVNEPLSDAYRGVMDAWLDPKAPHADAMDVLLHLHNGRGQTLLMMAAHAGRLDVVDRLIERDPAGLHDAVEGATPLIWAALGGSVDCVDRLLPLNDPSACDDRGGPTPCCRRYESGKRRPPFGCLRRPPLRTRGPRTRHTGTPR